ncbi:50S ribosomal protein L22 [Candidatus Giovannonibacteria bacterium]|nr:50S ribosomal protein L22 [Candidatus Giovannonibacteria bacterium]
MKEIPAKLNYLRISPRKVRAVADAIKGKSVVWAGEYLKVAPRTPRSPLEKLLKSAIANAKHNFGVSADKLFVKEVRVDAGPTLKRVMPRAFGRAYQIKKRSSHVTLVLGEK